MNNKHIKYVIGFPVFEDRVLLIKRKKDPWANFWNGLGGHIEIGESPKESIIRELKEEAKITSDIIEGTRFGGTASWNLNSYNKENTPGGMYIFIINLLKIDIVEDNKNISEGKIAWKSIKWACNEKNNRIAKNVPIYLSHILSSEKLYNYHFTFKGRDIVKSEIQELKKEYKV